MGRSPSITVGDTNAGLRVEHVKSRGLIRLVRWTAGRVEDDEVGLEVSDFCTRLGLTTDVPGLSHRYLLVAGAERPGAGHTVTLFATEDQARAAFVQVRRAEPGSEAWGEVSELTTGGDVRRVCWFGPTRSNAPEGHGTESPKRSISLRRALFSGRRPGPVRQRARASAPIVTQPLAGVSPDSGTDQQI